MKALIIDDEPGIRKALQMTLKTARIDAILAEDGAQGLKAAENIDVGLVFLDIKMPGQDGMEVLRLLRGSRPDLPVVMISGHGTIETAVQATQLGAFDFLEKPFDRERVLLVARNALKTTSLQRENTRLKSREATRILGSAKPIRELLAQIDRVAPTHARVLITGENGTGKELIAKRVHDLSSCAKGAFIDVNCAAIPKDLLESELFGHEKGSFTGAHALKKGKFELADGGTLFLDEIGDLDLAAQAKVLRVLEENKVERVGGSRQIDIDVRVLAATNKDLLKEVADGNFREDLYYRLKVVELKSPPLRERRDDIAVLAAAFLEEFTRRNRTPHHVIGFKANQALQREDWPGNVRQLRNTIENLAIMSQAEEITAADVTRALGAGTSARTDDPYRGASSFEEFKETAEREFLEKRLLENGWNVKRTAELLNMQRSNLYKKLDKYNLSKPTP